MEPGGHLLVCGRYKNSYKRENVSQSRDNMNVFAKQVRAKMVFIVLIQLVFFRHGMIGPFLAFIRIIGLSGVQCSIKQGGHHEPDYASGKRKKTF